MRRLVRIAAPLLLLAAAGCATFNPQPMEEIPFMERAQTQEREGLRITVAVLDRNEAKRLMLPGEMGERFQAMALGRGLDEELADDLRAQDAHRSFATLASYMAVNSVMVIGDPSRWTNPLVRVHSSCLTGDVFGSQRCECGPQMQAALERISGDEQGGLLVYMAGHEGRGIGLWAKAATYLLQDAGEDTYQANRTLGLPDDWRDFSDAASLLKYFLGGKPLRLLTNNPKKVNDLGDYGVTGITRVKHVTGVSDSNRRYLSAKQHWGHEIEPEDIG